nr:hypothetical protein Itr_chr01CG04200 [Ipomoea trifida]
MASSKTVFMLVFLMVILLGSPVVNVMGKSISNDQGDFVNSTGSCHNDADCDKICKCSPGAKNWCSDGLCVCGLSLDLLRGFHFSRMVLEHTLMSFLDQSEWSALMSIYGPQECRA